MANKIIIGLHGLANKPPKDHHAQSWQAAIAEGLTALGQPPAFHYHDVYWADLLYKYPLHNDEAFHFDSLFDQEPYYPADPAKLRTYHDSWTDHLYAAASDVLDNLTDYLARRPSVERWVDGLLLKKLKDLGFYYDQDKQIRNRAGQLQMVRQVLEDELEQALNRYQGWEIMLISHSMGTIIAYNTLRRLGKKPGRPEVAHFVTLGSPLGVPFVKVRVMEDHGQGTDRRCQVRTPSLVTKSWRNFADRDDPVNLDIRLADDYRPNARGVQVIDDLVANDYVSPHTGKANHHKIYGYLRCPEVAQHILDFLQH
ncbi:MAG: hypothetical protein MUC97_08770 [Bernardetiaceae bacterium]|jgi:hypothetical protein|nr:hypothetical protein [Bernardetiaceae bacterium]